MENLSKGLLKKCIHEVIDSRDSYLVEWGGGEEPHFDKESFSDDYTEALENSCDRFRHLFNKIGISCEVINGSLSEFNEEISVIDLSDEDNYYGSILPTEEGFEWRKVGFGSIELKDSDHIGEFIKFLSDKKYSWREQISGDVPYMTGILDRNYYKDVIHYVRNGFLHNHDRDDLHTYMMLGRS